MTPDIRILQGLQSQLVFLAHSYRQGDKFEIAQYLSNAGETIGHAIRAIELSHQNAAIKDGTGV